MSDHIKSFMAARRVSTPLVMIRTADAAITVRNIWQALIDQAAETKRKEPPLFIWDCMTGLRGVNEEGRKLVLSVTGSAADDEAKQKTANPVECLDIAVNLPAPKAGNFFLGSILFFQNCQVGFEPPNPNYIQAIWNLRDAFKANRRQLVMLTPGVTLPQEIAQDVMVIDEPLPNPQQLEAIVSNSFKDVGEGVPDGLMPKAIDALCGLAAYPAEQVTAMSLYRTEDKKLTIDLDALWSRKKQTIEQTPGLSVWSGGERFDDIGGLDNAKNFFRRLLKGRDVPRAIVFVDEIEKSFAGATAGTGDTSGVSQSFLGTILSEMQDNGYTGLIGVGPPGAGKSAMAKAIGNEGGIPTVSLDLGAMKGSLVGQSEATLRQAMKVIKAISQGRAFWFATSNRVTGLPPELRRRFTFGLHFYDLPNLEERNKIWEIYLKKYQITNGGERPDDHEWTGAEIKTCCDLAYRLDCPLLEAAAYIVPVAKAAREQIDELRKQANGRYISASYPGVYQHETSSTATGAGRAISLDE